MISIVNELIYIHSNCVCILLRLTILAWVRWNLSVDLICISLLLLYWEYIVIFTKFLQYIIALFTLLHHFSFSLPLFQEQF
jgi:hypothetical protein